MLGYKNGTNELITIKDKTDFSKIELQNVKWVLWVTKKIPDQEILNPNKVIRIYISDMSGNLYLLHNKFKQILLSTQHPQQRQQPDINNVVPILPTNITIKLSDETKAMEASLPSMSMLRSQSSNNPGELYSYQSVGLKINTQNLNIKYNGFVHQSINLVQQLKLNTKIQVRVFEFIKYVMQTCSRPLKTNLKLRFASDMLTLPQISNFEKLISCVFYEVEKALEEYTKLEQRDKIVEENISMISSAPVPLC